MTKNIRVLVVDDSAFMRKVISDVLNSDSNIEVIDTAKNGIEALQKAKCLHPDVITLDVEMPVMDGLTCLKELLGIGNYPVIMLSNLTKEGANATIKALEYGAIDFIAKPSNIFDLAVYENSLELISKVKMAKNISRIFKNTLVHIQTKTKNDIVNDSNINNLIAIGTSTGGPKALQDVLSIIPGNIPAAFLVVQHMPLGFTKSLAERINSMSELHVKEAEDGETIKQGYAYIAPGNYHMLVKNDSHNCLSIKLTQDPIVNGHRPSVDVLMNSLSDMGLTNIIGVIMTGMGSDGCEGIKKIKSVNRGYIIAQDEKTSVVFGMPRAVIQAVEVDAVVPLNEIAMHIMKVVGVN